MKKYLSIILVAVVCLAMLSGCGSSDTASTDTPAAGSITLRVALGNASSWNDMATAFKEEIEEKTDGEIRVDLFPDNQLGGEREVVEAAQLGAIDIAMTATCLLYTSILRQLAQRVKHGSYEAGGTPLEFGTVGACDGITMAHEGMKYVLPIREMIANDIEAMVQGHQLDGLVIMGSCDKIVPGMLLGALRVNVPAIFINGGPTLPGRMKEGNPYGGEYIDHSIIQESEGALKSGKITPEQFEWIENNAVPTIGSCAMLGTANTMCCLEMCIRDRIH